MVAYTDLPLDQVRTHTTEGTEPPDFVERWNEVLTEARARATPTQRRRVETGLTSIATADLTFAGHGGDPVRAWLQLPAARPDDDPLPCVVEYVGYGGGRGRPVERLLWASAGFAHLVMDTRGQGSSQIVGDTPDPAGSGPSYAGVMTRGIDDFDTYYYRRLVTDAVRAVDVARELPEVDPDRVLVTGVSQGGGLAIDVAGLADGLLGAMPDVPFLCDFPRATWIVDRPPYNEIAHYLATHRDAADRVARVLAYIDAAHHAARATAPALFSVALMDPTCPPSTVYAAYNAWAGPKEIVEYSHNGHEGGGAFQHQRQLAWAQHLARLR